MKKKCILLCAAALTLSFVLAACGAQKEPTNKNGKVVKDKEGHTHVIMTDANGETVVDEKGNLVEVIIDNDDEPVTHNDGTPQTAAVTFPNIVLTKEKVEISGLEVGIPKDWKNIGETYIVLEHKDSKENNATLTIQLSTAYASLEEAVDVQNSMAMKEASNDINVKVDEIDLAGIKMYRRTLHNGENDSYMIRYLFEHNANLYIADATVLGAYYDAINFDAIMNSIILK